MYNQLYYLASLIEFLARRLHCYPSAVADSIGLDAMRRIFACAEAYHCSKIDDVAEEIIEDLGLVEGGEYDPTKTAGSYPTHWVVGKIYARLVEVLCQKKQSDPVNTLWEVYHSFLSPKIQNFNLDIYYQGTRYLVESYQEGEILEA